MQLPVNTNCKNHKSYRIVIDFFPTVGLRQKTISNRTEEGMSRI